MASSHVRAAVAVIPEPAVAASIIARALMATTAMSDTATSTSMRVNPQRGVRCKRLCAIGLAPVERGAQQYPATPGVSERDVVQRPALLKLHTPCIHGAITEVAVEVLDR